jgi:hypothetical protein
MEVRKEKGDNSNILILDKMMKEFNYFPKVTEFESFNKEIPDKNNFSKIFNNFLNKLKDFDECFTKHASSNKIYKNKIYYYDSECDSYLFTYLNNNYYEVNEYLKDIWDKQYINNIKHICFFIILVDKYINVSGKITEYDKNILYWTVLYHDLGKFMNMNPIIKENVQIESYDKTHPFKSIIIFLNSAFEHDLFYYPNNEYKNELINMYNKEFIYAIYNSWNLETSENIKRYNMCFKYIEFIAKFFMKIKSQKENEWLFDICVLIIFHQSLPNNKDHMNSPLLEEKYIKIFFTKRLVELMRIIMVYDSASHSMFFGSYWVEQINLNMDEVTKLF